MWCRPTRRKGGVALVTGVGCGGEDVSVCGPDDECSSCWTARGSADNVGVLRAWRW